VPAEKTGGKPDRGNKIRILNIAPPRLTEFRKLAENHAREVKFLAARRIGELVPAEEKGGKPDRGSKVRDSDIVIPKQRLSEFRKLAENHR